MANGIEPVIPDQPMPDDPIEKFERARALIESGRIDDAVMLLTQIKAQHADNANFWFALGQAQGMSGRDIDAEEAFSRAVELRPEMHEAHLNLALSRVYQRKLREAIPGFIAARELRPDSPGLDKTLLDILQSILQESPGRPTNRAQLAPLMDAPLISIILPTRNRTSLLSDALSSVRRQTYPNWEIIVVNDGGDDISGVIGALPKDVAAKTTALRLPASAGQARARNRAIEASRGEVLAFLDDDDMYLPEHLQTLISGMRETGAGIAYTLSEKVNERLVDGKREAFQRNVVFEDLRFSRNLLLVRNFIPIDNWGIRRACFERCGVFDGTLSCMEDWDLLLRLSDHFDFHRITRVTNEVRIRMGASDSVSTRTPALSTYKQIYKRYPSGGDKLIELARQLYLNAQFDLDASPCDSPPDRES